MNFTYKTKDVCSTQINFRLEGDRVHDVRFTGGCNGNLKAIGILVEGMTVDEIDSKLRGNRKTERIRAPFASQRASCQKYRRPYSITIVYRKGLYIHYVAFRILHGRFLPLWNPAFPWTDL